MPTTGEIDVILQTYWPESIIAAGIIKYQSELPMEYINEGVSIDDEVSDYHPSGMNHAQSDALGGDIVRLFLIDQNETNVRKRIRSLAKVADDFNAAHTDSYYSHIYPRLRDVSWFKGGEGAPLEKWRRWAQIPVVFTINNLNLKE